MTEILAVIALYMLAMLYIGYRAKKSVKTSADFFIGGNRFGSVITAIALQKFLALLSAAGFAAPAALSWLLAAETVVACIMVGYALARYLIFLLGALRPARAAAPAPAGEN